ncbi:MAG: iron ABC transporter permease, partial [Boseongicola sp.]
MADEKTQLTGITFLRIEPWSLGGLIIALLVVLPIISVFWIAATPAENIWPHLLATTFPRYFENTLVIMGFVAVFSACVGATTAWLVVIYRFPGSRVLEWLLLMPLAVPGYLGAYALVDFLEFAGPVQTGLREFFDWQSARDYWFPDFRSRGGA